MPSLFLLIICLAPFLVWLQDFSKVSLRCPSEADIVMHLSLPWKGVKCFATAAINMHRRRLLRLSCMKGAGPGQYRLVLEWHCTQNYLKREHDISLLPTWVPRDLNKIADGLTHLEDPCDWTLNADVFQTNRCTVGPTYHWPFCKPLQSFTWQVQLYVAVPRFSRYQCACLKRLVRTLQLVLPTF